MTTILMKSDCRKFSANIFNQSKCQNCFKTKDVHSAEALESNRATRKISKCGYLFVAPDWDFSLSINRTKRWQRRWFVLYDDGELTYSLDEDPETIPQAVIDMNKVVEVSDAEDMTGNQFAIGITAPEKIHFVKGTCKEEKRWWFEVLSRFPKLRIRSELRRTATFPGAKTTSAIEKNQESNNNNKILNCTDSTHFENGVKRSSASRPNFFSCNNESTAVNNSINCRDVIWEQPGRDISSSEDDGFHDQPASGDVVIELKPTSSSTPIINTNSTNNNNNNNNNTSAKLPPRIISTTFRDNVDGPRKLNVMSSLKILNAFNKSNSAFASNNNKNFEDTNANLNLNLPFRETNNFIPYSSKEGLSLPKSSSLIDVQLREKLKFDDTTDLPKSRSHRYQKREVRGLKSQRSRSDGVAKMIPPLIASKDLISNESLNKLHHYWSSSLDANLNLLQSSSPHEGRNCHHNPVYYVLSNVPKVKRFESLESFNHSCQSESLQQQEVSSSKSQQNLVETQAKSVNNLAAEREHLCNGDTITTTANTDFEILRDQLITIQNGFKDLTKELREAHANYDYLEMAYNKLKRGICNIEELHESEMTLMKHRINDLTSKLQLSERNLRQAKQRIAKHEARQERRRSSLKGKDATTLSKEFELKLQDLEKMIVSLQTLVSNNSKFKFSVTSEMGSTSSLPTETTNIF